MQNKTRKIVDEILLFALMIVVIVRFFAERNANKELADILSWIMLVLVIVLIVCKLIYWLFPKWFNNKPTLDEIEEKQFGKKN